VAALTTLRANLKPPNQELTGAQRPVERPLGDPCKTA
jgi:hypothetical protein